MKMCNTCKVEKIESDFYSSGKIRGMLCNLCNQGLGHFKDNIEAIERAIKYLEEKQN